MTLWDSALFFALETASFLGEFRERWIDYPIYAHKPLKLLVIY